MVDFFVGNATAELLMQLVGNATAELVTQLVVNAIAEFLFPNPPCSALVPAFSVTGVVVKRKENELRESPESTSGIRFTLHWALHSSH